MAVDIRSTPESPVLKWGFVLLTAYTGVVGAFLYVLGCREPLPGTHEQCLKDRPAKGETQDVFDHDLDEPADTEDA